MLACNDGQSKYYDKCIFTFPQDLPDTFLYKIKKINLSTNFKFITTAAIDTCTSWDTTCVEFYDNFVSKKSRILNQTSDMIKNTCKWIEWVVTSQYVEIQQATVAV